MIIIFDKKIKSDFHKNLIDIILSMKVHISISNVKKKVNELIRDGKDLILKTASPVN